MNAAIATISFNPLFRGAFDVPALTEASKQAFIYNKGLLLTDRSFSGHSFSIPRFLSTENLCVLRFPPIIFFYPRSPALLDCRGFFVF